MVKYDIKKNKISVKDNLKKTKYSKKIVKVL